MRAETKIETRVDLQRGRRKLSAGPKSGWGFGSLLLALALALALGCTPPEIRPEDVEASIVRFGEYEIRDGRPTHMLETSEIRCELGRMFGVDYRLEFPEGKAGSIPVRLRWVHPRLEIPRLAVRGTESAAGSPNPMAQPGESSVEGRSLWSIAHPEELVPGRYEFQIRLRDGSRVLVSHAFEITGC